MSGVEGQKPRSIVYCHCAYAKVIDPEVKQKVLEGLCDSEVAFEAVPDLCEMSARKDPAIARLLAAPGLEIAACFPRAVRWLFHAAQHPLPHEVVVHNMREETADEIVARLTDAPREHEEEVSS